MNNLSSATRIEEERARKRAKRACESPTEERRTKVNRERNMLRRVSESEAQRLAADQQQKANHRASESEDEHVQRLAAGQQREANRRASESEAEHVQRLAANQQRDASRRASESDAEQEHRLSSNRKRIATYRANETVEQRQQRRANDRINATVQRSAARQSTFDQQRAAVDGFRQSINVGPFNPCYCCTRLCYNNGGSFMDANDSLLLPIHDRELSNVVHNSCNSVWICSYWAFDQTLYFLRVWRARLQYHLFKNFGFLPLGLLH